MLSKRLEILEREADVEITEQLLCLDSHNVEDGLEIDIIRIERINILLNENDRVLETTVYGVR